MVPEIGVIVPYYAPPDEPQRVPWLMEAVQSIYAQTFRNWELAIVLDGCHLDFSKLPPNVHLVELPQRRGPGAARNAGVKATTAPWIIGLDADDRLKPAALQAMYANRNERLIVYGDAEWIGSKSGVEHLPDWNLESLLRINGPVGVTALHARQAWEQSGGWLEHLAGLEDIEYWMRLTEQGYWGKHLDLVTFEYRQHDGSRTQAFKKNGTEAALVAEIRQRHTQLANLPERKNGKMALTMEMKYIGARMGGFTLPSSPSGVTYRCGGHGDYLRIEPADKDWLLSFRGPLGPEWMVMEATPPAVPFQAFSQPVVLPDLQTLPPNVPDVTEMNVPDALAAVAAIEDLPDLLLVHDMEEASPTSRKTVMKAIDKRIALLSGEETEDGAG